MMGPREAPGRARAALDRLLIAGAAVGAAILLWMLVSFVRAAVSPNESYAASIGLTLDACIASRGNGLTEAEAYADCRRPVPKRF